jgi:hypothetical protein
MSIIEYGDACKRCAEPMYPRSQPAVAGWREHDQAGFCHPCRVALDRPVVRRNFIDEDGILDDVAIERAGHGERDLRLTPGEIRATVHSLSKVNGSAYDVAYLVGLPVSSVREILDEAGVA